MKTPMRLLLATLLLNAVAGHCFAASQVTVDLTGQTLQSKKTIMVSSTAAIDAAPIYYYSFSGILSTSGKLQPLLGESGMGSLAQLFTAVDKELVPFLSGTLLNISDKLPFSCVNALKKGSVTVADPDSMLNGATIVCSARVKAGISKEGIVSGEITNVSFGVKLPGRGTVTDGTDFFTFDSGELTVQTNPIAGTYQPDLSFALHAHLYGVGITGTDPSSDDEDVGGALSRGETQTLTIALQNIGSQPDTFKFTATPVTEGWSQSFTYKGKNVTAAVIGPGFILPPPDRAGQMQPLAPGALETIVWTIKNKDAISGLTENVINAASNSDPTKQDAISDLDFAK